MKKGVPDKVFESGKGKLWSPIENRDPGGKIGGFRWHAYAYIL